MSNQYKTSDARNEQPYVADGGNVPLSPAPQAFNVKTSVSIDDPAFESGKDLISQKKLSIDSKQTTDRTPKKLTKNPTFLSSRSVPK